MAIVFAGIAKLEANPTSEEKHGSVRETKSRLENELHILHRYSEPGHEDPRGGIAFCNWNVPARLGPGTYAERDVPRDLRERNMLSRVANALERLGYENEWSDEWAECSTCHGAVRTSPNGWGWKRSYYETDDSEICCHECVREDPEEYLAWLEGSSKRAESFDLPLADLGYIKAAEDLQNGFHSGQDADPKVVAKYLHSKGVERFIFTLDDVGQFDMTFGVWIHKDEKDKIPGLDLQNSANVDGPSVSGAMQEGLRNAALANAQLPDIPGTVKFTSIRPDGSAVAALIPGEEFVHEGTKNVLRRIEEGTAGVLYSPDSSTPPRIIEPVTVPKKPDGTGIETGGNPA